MNIGLGHLGFDGEPDYQSPSAPTEFIAGTCEKMEVMRKRFEAGEHLHHPSDVNLLVAAKSDPVTSSSIQAN